MSRIGARVLTAAAVGGVVLASGVTPALAATTPTTTVKATASTKTPGCKSGTLPTAVLGNPEIKAGATEGVYFFHDAKGYEVEVTHPGKAKIVVTGTLYAGKGFARVDKVKLEGKDFVSESANHKFVSFRFTNFGGIDAFHAYADCSAVVKVSFKIDGKEAATTQVFLGKSKVSPTSVPFTIDRTKPAATLSATVSASV